MLIADFAVAFWDGRPDEICNINFILEYGGKYTRLLYTEDEYIFLKVVKNIIVLLLFHDVESIG